MHPEGERAGPLGAQPPPRVRERAASKVAHSTAFDQPGSLSERDIHSRVSAPATVLAQEPSPAVSQASNFVRVVGGFS